MKWWRTILILMVFCPVPTGCEKPGQSSTTQQSKTPPDGADLDALRALPYVGGTPADEDEPVGVVLHDPERSCPGYNLYTVYALCTAELIDEDGRLIKSWSYKPRRRWSRGELLPNGDLLVIGVEPGGDPTNEAEDVRYVIRFNWEGEILWKRPLLAHHDIEETPDGKLLALTFRRRLAPEINRSIETRDDELTLLDQDGTVSESHSLLEAVERNPAALTLNRITPSNPWGTPWVDIFHANSVEWMHHPNLVGRHPIYDLDNVLVCLRHQDSVVVVNWLRNELIWSWGRGEVIGPHDAQVLANGNLLMFDNGMGRGYSRAVEVEPITGQIVWEYQADPPESFYSEGRGSVQRQPNGNTLIAESDRGRAFEVTPDGEVVWKFVCPHRSGPNERASIVRMNRFPREFIQTIIDAHAE